MRPWRDHLEADDPLVDRRPSRNARADRAGRHPAAPLDGTAWDDDPSARLWQRGRTLVDGGGVRRGHPAGRRAAAGRRTRAGPAGGVVHGFVGRALVAHVGALRAGLVVVPANTAYSERELAHIVTDVRASAAVVGRPEQAALGARGRARPRRGARSRTSTSPTATRVALDEAGPTTRP